MGIAETIKSNKSLKKFVHFLLIPRGQARPRLWVKYFVNPFYHKRGKNSVIRRRTRIDVLPFNPFSLGEGSTIEDFSTINNGVGAVIIGNNSRIGIGNVVIGPVTVGNNVILAQNIVISGLNHGYEDIDLPIHKQPVSTTPIFIEDDSWIGANVVVTAGVTIGKHCVVAAGAVVTKDIPPFSIAVGNPARVIKQYNKQTGKWEKV
jgi:acetyltransferase-like isoleucine patch superfamily enzyme